MIHVPTALLTFCLALPNGRAAESIERTAETEAAIAYRLTEQDHRLLDSIQKGAFLYLWREVGSPGGFVKDRLTAPRVSNTGGIGFQLAALPMSIKDRCCWRSKTSVLDLSGGCSCRAARRDWPPNGSSSGGSPRACRFPRLESESLSQTL